MGWITPKSLDRLPKGSFFGLASALLFGVSTPFSKLLLPAISPVMLAGLLYLGAAVVVTLFKLSSALRGLHSAEAPLQSSDAPLLCAVVGFGGVLGPILMLLGLARISALTGSLLLNLEAVFTIVLAVFAFHEHLEPSSVIASLLVIAGALLLGWQSGTVGGHFLGVLAITAACLCWAIDNNLSQQMSLRDPFAVVQIKTIGAGLTSIVIALVSRLPLPETGYLIGALVLGGLSYGASLICVMLALRYLGAARQAVWFSTAPFMGAALSIPIFRTVPGALEVIGALSMVGGIFLLAAERHDHLHTHREIEHDHLHVHDDHHQHLHAAESPDPHSHRHQHAPVTHEHPHASDLHHRHGHGRRAWQKTSRYPNP